MVQYAVSNVGFRDKWNINTYFNLLTKSIKAFSVGAAQFQHTAASSYTGQPTKPMHSKPVITILSIIYVHRYLTKGYTCTSLFLSRGLLVESGISQKQRKVSPSIGLYGFFGTAPYI